MTHQQLLQLRPVLGLISMVRSASQIQIASLCDARARVRTYVRTYIHVRTLSTSRARHVTAHVSNNFTRAHARMRAACLTLFPKCPLLSWTLHPWCHYWTVCWRCYELLRWDVHLWKNSKSETLINLFFFVLLLPAATVLLYLSHPAQGQWISINQCQVACHGKA